MEAWQNFSTEVTSSGVYPKLSIIIATLNSAAALTLILDSLFLQDYSNFEVIIVDSGSTDRTFEVVKSYQRSCMQIYAVDHFERYEMLNWGISHAKGLYIHFLFPGNFYLYYRSLSFIMELALAHDLPHLVYSSCLLHKAGGDKILNRLLTLSLLKSGCQPTNLQSCWFHAEVFKEIGQFSSCYKTRGEFDLLCRFFLKQLRAVKSTRILIDYDLRSDSQNRILSHFWETGDILRRWFGFTTYVKWLIFQQDMRRYLLSLFYCIKKAFLGRI